MEVRDAEQALQRVADRGQAERGRAAAGAGADDRAGVQAPGHSDQTFFRWRIRERGLQALGDVGPKDGEDSGLDAPMCPRRRLEQRSVLRTDAEGHLAAERLREALWRCVGCHPPSTLALVGALASRLFMHAGMHSVLTPCPTTGRASLLACRQADYTYPPRLKPRTANAPDAPGHRRRILAHPPRRTVTCRDSPASNSTGEDAGRAGTAAHPRIPRLRARGRSRAPSRRGAADRPEGEGPHRRAPSFLRLRRGVTRCRLRCRPPAAPPR